MNKNILLVSFLVSAFSFAQVGINTETPRSTLDVVGAPIDLTKVDGVIAPRISGNNLANKDILYTSAQTGAIVYVTAAVSTPTAKTSNVTSVGYYYFDGTVWIKMTTADVTADNGLTKTGNNIQLGGTLLKNTDIATAGFNTTFSGAGNFGIGSNVAPAEKLVVTGNSNISGKLRVGTTFNDGALSIKNNVASEYIASFVSSGNFYRTVMLDNGNVGFGGIVSPSENLDVNNNVRVRGINTNVGNSNTDKVVVADANGVLKTLAKPNPLLTGGTLADAIATATTVTVTAGAPDNGGKIQSLINYTFTLDKLSLVTFNYQLSFSVTTAGLTNAMKIVRSYLAFTAGSLPLNQQFGYQSTPHSAITGRPGFFYHNASESLVMQPGTYTVQLYGNVLNTTIASDPDFTVIFGDGPDRFTITAMPVY